jgi:DNA-binding GntR family transcriptional regulator
MTLEQHFANARAQSASTPEIVAYAVREAILSGLYAPGQPLRQDAIAAALGLSKIPVREALRRLEAEGLVALHPNRGAVVAPLVAQEAQEIAEIRIALETLALRLALPGLTQRDLRLAAGILDDLDAEADITRWGALNRDFHQTLYVAASRPQLLGLIATQHRRFDRYMRVVLASMRHQPDSQAEHRALLAACTERDEATVTAILERHIATAAALLAAQLRADPISA